MDSQEALARVADFLERFYAPEEHDYAATTRALTEVTYEGDARGLARLAFERVLASEYPPLVLRDLVRNKANRQVADDHAARGFVWKVYNLNVLDCAVPPDSESGDG